MLVNKAKLPKNLPEWFCEDKYNHVSDRDIEEKIKLEVCQEVVKQGYSLELCGDELVSGIAHSYFKCFDRLYKEMLASLVA
jgi:hypothetical protein